MGTTLEPTCLPFSTAWSSASEGGPYLGTYPMGCLQLAKWVSNGDSGHTTRQHRPSHLTWIRSSWRELGHGPTHRGSRLPSPRHFKAECSNPSQEPVRGCQWLQRIVPPIQFSGWAQMSFNYFSNLIQRMPFKNFPSLGLSGLDQGRVQRLETLHVPPRCPWWLI